MAEPERIALTMPVDLDDPNPRSDEEYWAKRKTREIPEPGRQHHCAICARKGFIKVVEFTPGGAPTGLCTHHNRFEREFRGELKLLASMQALTPKIVAEARHRIVQRMKETGP